MVSDSSLNELRFALFDSGVGGFSVLVELANALAGFDFDFDPEIFYLADTARCPYGPKSEAQITGFVEQISKWYLGRKVNNFVMACNTSAAIASNKLRLWQECPVWDLINLTCNDEVLKYNKILVLATLATVNSKAFSNALQAAKPDLVVEELASGELVNIVETGDFSSINTRNVLKYYADYAVNNKFDAVIFGCTHFPFLIDQFRKYLPESSRIDLINPAKYLASQLGYKFKAKSGLSSGRSLRSASDYIKNTRFFTTGNPDNFAIQVNKFLNLSTDRIEYVDVQELEQCKVTVNSPNHHYINDLNIIPKFA